MSDQHENLTRRDVSVKTDQNLPTLPTNNEISTYEEQLARLKLHARIRRRQPLPRGSAAIEFLRCLRPSAPWVITSIVPDGVTCTRTFTDVEEARKFIAAENAAGKNVYYTVNRVHGQVQSKPKKNEIAEVDYLHIDADPKEEETPGQFKARTLPLLENSEPAPAFLIDSGNGIQALWKLDRSVKTEDSDTVAAIEVRNLGLTDKFGAPAGTQNIDRILRLPGTWNWPNAKKRRQGRVKCWAKLLSHQTVEGYLHEDITHPLSAFPPRSGSGNESRPTANGGSTELPANLRTLLHVEGAGAYPSRHEMLFAFLTGGIRAGVADTTMIEACLDATFAGKGIYEHVKDNGGHACAVRQLQRAHEKAAANRASEKIHSWEEPDPSLLDDRRGELPEFPLDKLPEPLADWVQRAAHDQGVSVDHVALPMLGVTSSLIGTGRRAQAKNFTQPAALWGLVVGYSGDGKTPGLDATRIPLDQVERHRRPEIDRFMREHDEKVTRAQIAKEQWKKSCKEALQQGREQPSMPDEAHEPPAFIIPRLYTNDSTIEKLAVLLTPRPQGGLMIQDELSGLFANMGRYNRGEDRQFWLAAWDGKPYKLERMKRYLDLDYLLIGLVGGTQPDKLSDMFKGAADGMYARFLFSWPRPAPYQPLSNTVGRTNFEMQATLRRLADLPKLEGSPCIPLSAKALAEFEALRHDHKLKKQVFEGRELEWLAKLDAQVLRLSLTLSFLRWAHAHKVGEPEPRWIMLQDLQAACDLMWYYFHPHAFACLRQIGLSQQQAHARRVLRWLQTTDTGEVSREDVRQNALGKTLNADGTQRLLDELTRAGWLRRISSPSGREGGRPKLRWEVNPRLHAAQVEGR